MNDNLTNNSYNNNGYKATNNNLNTAIDNPSIDVDSVTGINIQNNQSVTSFSSVSTFDNNLNRVNNNLNQDNIYNNTYESIVKDNNNISGNNINNNNNFSTINNIDTNDNNNFSTTTNNIDTSDNYSSSINDNSNIKASDYEAVYAKKEIPNNNKIVFSKDLKLVIFIVFLLFIFTLFLPTLFDLFNKLIILITPGR